MDDRYCWLCGRNGCVDPLDRHHIFGGAYRDKSEQYGLVVDLCHNRCHIFGKKSAHKDKGTVAALKVYGQRKVMREQGWPIERFVSEFGKDYEAMYAAMGYHFDP